MRILGSISLFILISPLSIGTYVPAQAEEVTQAAAPATTESAQKKRAFRGPRIKDPLNCAVDYSHLVAKAQLAAKKARFLPETENATQRWHQRIRDRVTEQLAYRHGHHFSATSATDTSPLDSWQLSQDAFGRFAQLPEEQRALFPNSIDDIKARLLTDAKLPGLSPPIGLIEYVETYPARVRAFTDEIHTAGAQVAALEQAIPRLKRSENISIELPYVDAKEDGTLEIVMKDRFFPNRNKAREELKRLRKKIESHSFSMDQVNAVTILQRFMQQIRSQLSHEINTGSGRELPEDVKGIYNRILALYENGDGLNLKRMYRVPSQVWDDVRKAEFWGELKAVRELDVPKIGDRIANDRLLATLRSLPPAVVRDIGIGRLANSTSFLGRTRAGALVTYAVTATTGLGGTAVGLNELGPELWNKATTMIADEETERQECIAKESSEDFSSCARVFLQKKFGIEENDPTLSELLTKNEGSLLNASVNDTMRAIANARVEHLRALAQTKALNEKLDGEIAAIVQKTDPASDEYRANVLATDDTSVFTHSLYGHYEKNLPSMLDRLFPEAFQRNEEALKTLLLEQPLGSTKQEELLKKLGETKANAPMVEWLQKIIAERLAQAVVTVPGVLAPKPSRN